MQYYIKTNGAPGNLFLFLLALVTCCGLVSAVEITNLHPASKTFNISQTIEINATISDADGIDSAYANITYPNQTIEQITLTAQAANKYNNSFTIPDLPGNFTLLIWANDTLGNTNTSNDTFSAIFSDPRNINGILLWLDATDNTTLFTDTSCSAQVANDSDEVLCWQSKASNQINVTVVSGKSGARFRSNASVLLNGETFLAFNKTNESVYETGIDIRANTTEDLTIFSTYRPRTNDTGDQGQAIWGNDDGSWDRFYYSLFSFNAGLGTDGIDDGLISLGGASSGLSIDGAGIIDTIFLLTAIYDGNVSGGTNSGPTNASKIYFDGNLQVSFTDQSHATAAQTQMFIGNDGDNGHYDGDLAEIIVYNQTLNACQLETVNKYLSGKYGKDFFSISDNYGFSSPHNNDINGIAEVNGNCTATVEITSATSSIATISNPSDLDLNDSLTFAHDNGGFTLYTEAPGNYSKRINQSWRVDIDNTPGNVTLAFDFSSTTISTTSEFALIIDTNTNFSDATIHSSQASISGNTVTFSDINLSNADYFTLAVNENFTDPTSLTNLRAWYDAADNTTLFTDEACTSQVSVSGDAIRCWQDKSNYSANATNVSGKGVPEFATNIINEHSVVSFNKSESDTLRHVLGSQYTSDFSIFAVLQSKDSSPETYESFFSNGEPASTDHFQIDYTNDSGQNSFRYGASTKFNFETFSNEVKLYSVTHNGSDVALYNEGQEVNNGSTTEGRVFEHYRVNQNRNGDRHHESYIAEIILYDRVLSTCELEKVNIYLGEKYGRDFFGLRDNYGYGSPHDNDINGVGEFASACGSSKEFTSAKSSIATIFDPTTLDLNDSLTFAHDNGGSLLFTEAPTGYEKRINQSWRVDVDNTPGNISVSFDLSAFGLSMLSTDFALLIDSNTNFSDASTHTTGFSVSGTTVTFTNISLSSGGYFTLGLNEKEPDISFADPTLPDAAIHNQSSFTINMTSSAFGEDHYVFVNFDNSLLLWLRMDDTNASGDPIDASGNGNNGSLQGDATINTTGRFGNATHLDGSGDFINLPASNSLVENQAAWTISMWFNTKSISSESLGNRIVTLRNASGLSATAFTLGSSNQLQFFYRNTTGSGKTQNITTVSTNTWYHYAVTYNGSQSKVYVDGVLNATITDTITGTSSDTARIGANPTGSSQFFNGSLDELIILNHELPSHEIAALYNASANQFFGNTTTLQDGNHTFIGYAVGANGLTNQTETRTITIDTTPPNATLTSPTNNTFTNTTNQNLTVNISDNIGLANATLVVLNESNDIINQTTVSLSGQNALIGTVYNFFEGVFKWFYKIFDSAGNFFQTSNNTITVDTTPPSVTALVPANTATFDDTTTIEIAANVSDTIQVSTVYANITFPNTSTTLLTLSNVVADKYNASLSITGIGGSFTLSIIANDTAGNINDSEQTTFTHTIPYPGAISTNITLWLDAAKSDSLYQSGCSGTQSENSNATGCWKDRSYNYYNVTASSTERPALYTTGSQAINFNPALHFDGSNDFLEDATGENYINGVGQFSTFVIVDAANAANDGYIFNAENDSGSEAPWGLRFDDTGALSGRDNTLKTGINTGSQELYEGNESFITSANPLLLSVHWQSGSAPSLFVDGKNISIHPATTKSGTLTSANYVRIGHEANQDFWNGTIAELIYYQQNLNSTAKQKVDSYLAVKYGITLNETVNYLSSSDTVIYNSTGANQNYTSDIAGIGRDDTSDLSQLKSKSSNTDSILIINASSLDNEDFLLWGNDNGSLSETNVSVPISIEKRLERMWRVQTTNTPGATTLSFNLSNIAITGTAVEDFHLLTNQSSANVTNANIHAATSFENSVVTFDSVTLADGTFFTLATANKTFPPDIFFIDPTLSDSAVHNQNSFIVNVSSNTSSEDHYTFVDFDNSLLLWLRMDDTNASGDPVDLSNRANNGTLEGNALINSTGRFGNASHFDGAGDDIVIPDAPSIRIGASAFTYAAWFNTKSSVQQQIFGKRENSAGNYEVQIDTSGKLRTYIGDVNASSGNMFSSTTISQNTWYHVAVTRGDGTLRIYVNGVEENQTSSTHNVTSSNDLYVGRDSAGASEYFNGSIDEVILFNRSLSATEISSLYNASANQYEHNFSALQDGNHSFIGYAMGENGKKNQTETRTVTIDTTPPSVTDLNVTPTSTYNLSATITISANVSDTTQVSAVRANITLPNTTINQITLAYTSGDHYNTTYQVPGLIGNYTVTIIANDTGTNTNATETSTFEVQNDIPTPSSVQINSGSDITLTAGANTSIIGSATVTDLNGYTHITGATGYLFLTTVLANASNNRSNHYTTTCSDNGDGNGNTISYNCTFNVSHYAIPTDAGSNKSSTNWTFLFAPLDDQNTGENETDVVDMNTLLAFNITPSIIDFGALSLGQNTTSTNQEINVTNRGNVDLDVLLSGTNFSCAPGIIPVNFLEYQDNPFTYGVGTDLLETGIELDLDAKTGYETNETPLRTTYYGLGSPASSVGGSCSGTIILTGQSDPHSD